MQRFSNRFAQSSPDTVALQAELSVPPWPEPPIVSSPHLNTLYSSAITSRTFVAFDTLLDSVTKASLGRLADVPRCCFQSL